METPLRMANVLVVDDEENIRFVIREMLEHSAHRVMEAQTGSEALKTFEQEGVPDLVITDLVMPDKNGIDLILDLKKRYPEVKVLAMSGGGGNGKYDYIPIVELIGAGSVLRKPFNLSDMHSLVEELLETG